MFASRVPYWKWCDSEANKESKERDLTRLPGHIESIGENNQEKPNYGCYAAVTNLLKQSLSGKKGEILTPNHKGKVIIKMRNIFPFLIIVTQRHSTHNTNVQSKVRPSLSHLLFSYFTLNMMHQTGKAVNVSVGGDTRWGSHLTVDASHVSIQVCVYFSTSGVQLSSQLVDVWSAFSSSCLHNIRRWKPSFLSVFLPSLFASYAILQEIYTYK